MIMTYAFDVQVLEWSSKTVRFVVSLLDDEADEIEACFDPMRRVVSRAGWGEPHSNSLMWGDGPAQCGECGMSCWPQLAEK